MAQIQYEGDQPIVLGTDDADIIEFSIFPSFFVNA